MTGILYCPGGRQFIGPAYLNPVVVSSVGWRRNLSPTRCMHCTLAADPLKSSCTVPQSDRTAVPAPTSLQISLFILSPACLYAGVCIRHLCCGSSPCCFVCRVLPEVAAIFFSFSDTHPFFFFTCSAFGVVIPRRLFFSRCSHG